MIPILIALSVVGLAGLALAVRAAHSHRRPAPRPRLVQLCVVGPCPEPAEPQSDFCLDHGDAIAAYLYETEPERSVL